MIRGHLFAGLNSYRPISVGDGCLLVTRPQLPFRPIRFFVCPSIAQDFKILAIHVGMQCEGFVNTEPVPASMFSTVRDQLPLLDERLSKEGILKIDISKPALDVIGLDIAFPKLKPGMDIVVNVMNISGRALAFRGAIIGIPEE